MALLAVAPARTVASSATLGYDAVAVNVPPFVTAGPIAGVDPKGDVAGTLYERGNDYPDCGYFDGRVLLDLSANSGNFCTFFGMNDHGLAVGEYYDFSAYLNYGITYRPGHFTYTNALIDSFLAVNDAGLVAGNLSVASLAVYELGRRQVAYKLYDPNENCSMSYPYAINDNGVVLGSDDCRGTTRYEIVLNGVFTYLTPPPGYYIPSGSHPAFNNSADIVIAKTGSGHAFLWSTTGHAQPLDLGALASDPTGTYTATALNDDTVAGKTSDGYAWIWTARGGMQNLASLLPPNPYGTIVPEAIDAQGDLGCSASLDNLWIYLRRRR